jgi:hypothetical protein
LLAATLPTASFLRFAFCQGTPGIPDFREVLQHFPLQWAAYFGRAVAKLDHSCVAPLSPSQIFYRASQTKYSSFATILQLPPKTTRFFR